MEDKINVQEEILKLTKEINELKAANNELKKIIKDQSLEIKNLKDDYNKDKNEMLSEIQTLKEKINNLNSEEIQKLEKGQYITSISFFISKSIDLSLAELLYYGYEPVEGDIRKDAGGLYCILGCKYEKNQEFITNIIGSVNDKEEPVIIYENEIRYNAIKDPLNNSDIHKGSGGNFLSLYFTKDPKAGKPIKRLKTLNTKEFLKDPNIVKYCSRKTKYNEPFEPLDCNRGRGKFTSQNYIFIERD